MNTYASELHRDQRIAASMWVWFACGCVALLLVPGLRGRDPTFGWLAFWLIGAPLIDLLLLSRLRMLAAVGAFLVRRARRRRPLRQARRLRRVQSTMPSRFLSIRRRNSDMMRRYRSSPR